MISRRKVSLALLPGGLALLLFLAPPGPPFAPDYSTLVVDEDGHLLRAFLNQRQQWCFPPRAEQPIPVALKTSVLHFEDRNFYHHIGLNPASLIRALYQNIAAGRIVSGASTLTMQVTRLARPKERTYFNKALEILQALRLELYYSKEEILRLYLDHAPYGGNIVGYRAASLRYFQKGPEHLTWGEAATLAVLPNAPGLVSPQANPERLRHKRDRLLHRLRNAGEIDASTCALALLEPVPTGAHSPPLLAPHLAQLLKDQQPESSGIIRTTLRHDLQQKMAELVARHLELLRPQGIRNGAALLVETGSAKVRAYVGSQDFFDDGAQGQVDGVRAWRSSGSLLKPFLYALSMDAGVALPQTLLRDVPTHYGTFSPSNADEKFSGLVALEEALIRSLNVPAVRLLHGHGLYSFYRFLKNAGLKTLFRTADDYGLPLIIGGAEVNLWDMATLFRGLGAGGRFAPLYCLADDPVDPAAGASLISPGASYLTLNVLRQLQRPGSEYYWQQYQNARTLAWKTGTSYGQRDAWAVGVNPQWTMAVWVGNFDGKSNTNLSGARTAAPLLFDIFNTLSQDASHSWFAAPEWDLAAVELCDRSGFAAGPHCPQPIFAAAPYRMPPLPLCPYHRSLYVNAEETQQVCSLCWETGAYQRVQRLVFPADIVQQLRRRGQLWQLPPHRPSCRARTEDQPLKILYPQSNARLRLARDFGGRAQQVVLRAAHSDKSRILYWYLDHDFLGTTTDQHTRPAQLEKGWHTLEIVDGNGNRARTRFYASNTYGWKNRP